MIIVVASKLSVGTKPFLQSILDNMSEEVILIGDVNEINTAHEKVVVGSGGNSLKMMLTLFNIFFYAKFVRLLLRNKSAVVYFATSYPSNFIAALLSKLFCRRVVSHIHDPLPHSGTWYALFIRIFQQLQLFWTNDIIVAGDSLVSSVRENYFLPKMTNIYICPFGAFRKDHDAIPNFAYADRRYISILGRIESYKGISDFILWAEKYKLYWLDKNITFVIAGPGSNQEVTSAIARSTLEIIYRPEIISDYEFDIICSKSLSVVLPYRDATQSGVPALSLRVGTPVVVRNRGSLPEIINASRAGHVFEYYDEELFEFFQSIADNSDKFFRLQKNATDYFENYLRWSKLGPIYQGYILSDGSKRSDKINS